MDVYFPATIKNNLGRGKRTVNTKSLLKTNVLPVNCYSQ